MMTDNERRIYLLRISGLEEDVDSYRDIDKNNLLEIERLRKMVPDQDALDVVIQASQAWSDIDIGLPGHKKVEAAIAKLRGDV